MQQKSEIAPREPFGSLAKDRFVDEKLQVTPA